MATVQVIEIGDELGIILPADMLARLNVGPGDTLYIAEIPEGLRLSPFDPDFAEQMDAARGIMRENSHVLNRLKD